MDSNPKFIMGWKKATATRTEKGKRSLAGSSRWPPQLPKKPQMGSSSTPSLELLFRNQLQKESYELFQGFKYVCGRQVD